ncbi:MAG: FliO/MopB family protein [Planctomycetes bacterium]|nr:FliO/MopB family protein [Planctomycetota bacterium]
MKCFLLKLFVIFATVAACLPTASYAQTDAGKEKAVDTAADKDVPASELLPVTDTDTAGAKPRASDYTPNFFKFLLYTALVIGMIFLAFYGIKRFLPGSKRLFASDAIQIIARRPVDSVNSINLVLIGNRILIVGVTKTGLKTLSEITDPHQVALLKIQCGASKPDSSQADFNKALNEAANDLESYDKDAARSESYKKLQGQLDEIKETMKKWNAT